MSKETRASGGRKRRANDTHSIARWATISSCCGQGGGLESISGLWSSPQRWYHYKQTLHINTTFTTNTSCSLHGKHMWWGQNITLHWCIHRKPQCTNNSAVPTLHSYKCQDFIENVEFAMLLYFFTEIIQRNPVHSEII